MLPSYPLPQGAPPPDWKASNANNPRKHFLPASATWPSCRHPPSVAVCAPTSPVSLKHPKVESVHIWLPAGLPGLARSRHSIRDTWEDVTRKCQESEPWRWPKDAAMASPRQRPRHPPLLPKWPHLDALGAVLIRAGSQALAEQLRGAHGRPEETPTAAGGGRHPGPRAAPPARLLPAPGVRTWTAAREIRACREALRTWT